MEQFRQLLRFAVSQKALRVKIRSLELAEYYAPHGELFRATEVGLFDAGTVRALAEFLFPNAKDPGQGLILGQLQVPQLGELPLIGAPAAGVFDIYVYFPGSDVLYQKELKDLKKPSIPPPPRVQNEPIAAPTPSAHESQEFGTVGTATPQALESNAHVNPEELFSPKLKFVTHVQPNSVSADANANLSAIGKVFEVPDESDRVGSTGLFAMPGSLLNDSNPPAESSDQAVAEPARIATTPSFSTSQFLFSKVEELLPDSVDTGNTKINFSADSAEEGIVSRGQNPIDSLLKHMIDLRASDMHLTMTQPLMLRIDGDMTTVGREPLTADMMESYLAPTVPRSNAVEFAKTHDTDYAYELAGVGRFRVNLFRDRYGVAAVLRHIPAQILTAEALGLSPAIMNFCKLSKGLVLVTGPTGSGKSTTLAAMLDWINANRREHILTIEDPIEFVHRSRLCLVNQREVRKHTGSFSRALKAALREDPDVILIGEMRDLETVSIAIETAETGHLVFGTLHTTTAVSTIDRIIDQFPSDRQAQIRTMLSSSLKGVVAQTLLKKKGGGRVAAQEILVSNDAVAAMIRENKNHMIGNHMLTQKQDGNQMLNDTLLKLVADGIVSPQDALFKSVDKNDFMLSASRRNIKLAS